MKKKLLGFYDYTVILTYCGMLFAVAGLFLVLKGSFLYASVCLLLAGVCDMFDGAVASTKERTAAERCFGIQIDSLCDLISFGVLPGMFVYCLLERRLYAGIIASVFILCALIRLAYFNVLEEERQQQTTGHRESYLGVPVTTVAVLLPAVYELYAGNILQTEMAFAVLLVLMAAGFIIPIQIRKPRGIGKIGLLLAGAAELVGILLLV